MLKPTSTVARVRSAIIEHGIRTTVRELSTTTHTAADAAAALRCEIAQIAKTVVFETKPNSEAVLVIASGAKRINEDAVAKLLDRKIAKASAKFVLEKTGFVIGGVSPIGSITPLTIVFDSSLLHFKTIWAAAGSSHAVFEVTPSELRRATNAILLESSISSGNSSLDRFSIPLRDFLP